MYVYILFFPACTFGSTATINTLKNQIINPTAPLCRNVVKSVSYSVKTAQDEFSTIASVSASVLLTDVPTVAGKASTLSQTFSLKFTDDGVEIKSHLIASILFVYYQYCFYARIGCKSH